MRSGRILFCIIAASLPIYLGGCGTTVPLIGEIWDDQTGTTAVVLEKKVKEKIYCELNKAVYKLNNEPDKLIVASYADPKNPSKTITKKTKPVPEGWGATLTLTLTVEEMSGLNPSASLNNVLLPKNTTFPGGIVVPGPQSFTLGLGGTLSSDATRYDKYTFFYKVKDLETYNTACDSPESPGDVAPKDFQGSSLLLESDLGMERWLQKASDIRTGIGVSGRGSGSSAEVLSYDVKFDVVSSGNINPAWKLTPVTTATGSSPLFATKRERTHEMLLTLGPLSDTKSGPSTLSANDALAAQIGAAVGAAVKSAIGQ
jgi:hypothetical protein